MKPIQCLRENVDLDLLLRLRKRLVAHKGFLDDEADGFALIGNPTRLSILWLIAESPQRELCPCDLADVLGITVPAVSQQVQRLRRGKLLTNRRAGKTIFYSLTEAGNAIVKAMETKEARVHDA